MRIFYDTHAHLDYPDFAADFSEVMQRAQEAGITKILSIGTRLESSQRAIQLAEKFPNVYLRRMRQHEVTPSGQQYWSDLCNRFGSGASAQLRLG